MVVSGAYSAMPILVLNLGGEMLYVLNQRLTAQKVAREKALAVLSDVASALFSDNFTEELFKPQKLYTDRQMKQVFHQLAHASMMRLNESSMGKLYDLMSMGVKYMIMSAKRASQILDVTFNHLDGIAELLKGADKPIALVQKTKKMLMLTYGPLKTLEWSCIRRLILTYFQDWRVKISTFLKLNIQANDGNFVIEHGGEIPGFDVPGAVKGVKSYTLKVENAKGVEAKGSCRILHGLDIWYSEGGLESAKKIAAEKSKERGKQLAKMEQENPSRTTTTTLAEAKIDENSAKAVKAELNALANLLHGSQDKKNTKDNFNLDNIFAPTEVANVSNSNDVEKELTGEVVSFDGKKGEWNRKLRSKINLDEPEDDDDGDDLLALMDGS